MLEMEPLATLCFIVVMVILFSCPSVSSGEAGSLQAEAAVRPDKNILAGLRRDHPRLLFTKVDQGRIEKLAETNALLAELIEHLKHNADRMLTEPTVHGKLYSMGSQKIMLFQSRNCVAKITTLAMAYRLTGNRQYAERARKEMLAAADLENWNPKHFLDTAEMCCAVAIGYDWLYDVLSETDRATIRKAIVTNALQPGMDSYLKPGYSWWPTCNNNWNQVCNSGLTLGALAVAEDEPVLSAKIVSHALRSIRNGMSTYKPDGAWPEGPSYWEYGTGYNVLMIAAMDSALGQDFGLSKTEGFDRTGLFRIHTIKPNGACFNYADGGFTVDLSPAMFYLSHKFNRPTFSWFERKWVQYSINWHKRNRGEYKISYFGPSRFYAMEIAWFDDRGETPEGDELPLDACFRGKVDVVTMRSHWGDRNALYVSFKGGDNSVTHAHMDIGSFVMDADELIVAMDPGSDNYGLPGYWDSKENGQRWKYYRLGSKGHNTLVIGGKLQRVEDSESKVIDFLSTPDRAHAIVDMTNAYRGQAKKVLRGVAMLDRSRVLVQDEITCLNDAEIRWAMVTLDKIELEGSKAMLRRKGRTIQAEILAPAGAKFEIVTPPPPVKGEHPRPKNMSMLAVFVKPTGGTQVRLVVLLTPVGKQWKKLPPPKIQSLNEWKKHAKNK